MANFRLLVAFTLIFDLIENIEYRSAIARNEQYKDVSLSYEFLHYHVNEEKETIEISTFFNRYSIFSIRSKINVNATSSLKLATIHPGIIAHLMFGMLFHLGLRSLSGARLFRLSSNPTRARKLHIYFQS